MRERDVVQAPYKRDLSLRKRGALLQVAILKTSMDSYRRVIPICALYVICQFILIRSGVNISMEQVTVADASFFLKSTQNGILTMIQDTQWVIHSCCSSLQIQHQEFWDLHLPHFILGDQQLDQEEIWVLETETCRDQDTCRKAEWKLVELFTSWIFNEEKT
jgi:hypothetical protein